MHPPLLKAKYVILILCITGVVGLSIPLTQNIFVQLTPFYLLTAMLVLFYFHREWDRKIIFYLISIAAVGYFLELVGVNTGKIFGVYQYGNALGVKLFKTPLLIGLNWLMLIYCAFVVSDKILSYKYIKAIIGASILLAYDIILEPIAIELDMWRWETAHVPLQNYAIWFLFSFTVLFILHHRRVEIKNPIADYILTLQIGFFLFLRFTL